MIHIAICDDEKDFAAYLTGLLNRYAAEASFDVEKLVGVLNYTDSMVTSVISRKREFAMMQSIGMTKRQLRRMLLMEGLDYAGLTLAASYVISALAVGIGIRAVTAGGYSTFHFTLMPLGICTPVLTAAAVLIPYICFKNLEKQSIGERLRAVD